MKKRWFFAVFLAVVFNGGALYAAIPDVEYVKSLINDMDVNIELNDVVTISGDQTITGDKTFEGAVQLATDPDDDSNDQSVPTTQWTNTVVNNARGEIPVGGPDAVVFTKIWIED